jgi:hypothetical protein
MCFLAKHRIHKPACFVWPVGTHVSAFRINYCKLLMVLLPVLLALLHVVSLLFQITVPVYWWQVEITVVCYVCVVVFL